MVSRRLLFRLVVASFVLSAAVAVDWREMRAAADQQPAAAPAAPAAPGAQAPAGAPGRGAGRGRAGGGGPADPFAGQPRINALVVSGGCCHNYGIQGQALMDAVNKGLPVDWTVAYQGGRGTNGTWPIYRDAKWAEGFDLVVHNECSANVTDQELVRRVTQAHRPGPPALVIHCAMHTFRSATFDDWREFLGVTTMRHTAAHNIKIKLADGLPSQFVGFNPEWTTPVDELYVIDKFWPGAKAIATAVSPEDQKEYPLIWTYDYKGTRVFGTTLGHGNDTWNDPTFQDLMVRAFKWALNR